MKKLRTKEFKPIELPEMPQNPLVSVLIANYNYARYIGEAIESVLNQTYPYFEIIVCDDGSTDNSCEVIEAYAQRFNRLILVRQQNGRVASALNAAYQQSSGQIICLLDSDDIWMSNKLQKVIEAFKSDPKCGFVIHNVVQIDGHGKFIQPTPMFSKLASGWMAPLALENGGFVDKPIPPTSALCLVREVSDLIFPINEAFVNNADGLINSLALLATVIVPVSDVLSMYRLHGANITGTLSANADTLESGQNARERIHQEQRRFLISVYGAQVAEKLTDLKVSLSYLSTRYLISRLKGAPKSESREAHQHLVTHPQFGQSVIQRWLLWGEYLPNVLFAALFHFVYGSSQLKRLVKLIFGGVLNMRHARG